jgi:endogenous inhibitor of DNA gyrase (YacG/DUF329 family)
MNLTTLVECHVCKKGFKPSKSPYTNFCSQKCIRQWKKEKENK